MVWRSKNRAMGIAIGLLSLAAAFVVAPQEYKDRLYSITEVRTAGSRRPVAR